MKIVDQFLYGVIQEKSSDEPEERDQNARRSISNLEDLKGQNPYHPNDSDNSSYEETSRLEPQELQDITILPNYHIPIVIN